MPSFPTALCTRVEGHSGPCNGIRRFNGKTDLFCNELIVSENPDRGNTLRPRNREERKAEPIHSGVLLYFPDALAAVARVSKSGNDVHNPGEPLHWARGKSMDQMDAATRHMLTLSDVDTDSGELEAAHCAWRALAQLQLLEEKRLAAAGIKPYSGIVP